MKKLLFIITLIVSPALVALKKPCELCLPPSSIQQTSGTLAFSQDEKCLINGSFTNVRSFAIINNQLIPVSSFNIPESGSSIIAVAFTPNNSSVIVLSKNLLGSTGAIDVFPFNSKTCEIISSMLIQHIDLTSFSPLTPEPLALAVSNTSLAVSNFLVSGFPAIAIFPFTTDQTQLINNPFYLSISNLPVGIKFSHDNNYLAVLERGAGFVGFLEVFNASTWQRTQPATPTNGVNPRSLDFSQNDRCISTAHFESNNITTFNFNSNGTFDSPTNLPITSPNTISYSSDACFSAVGGTQFNAGTIKIYDVCRTTCGFMNLTQSLPGRVNPVIATYSPSGKLFAVGYNSFPNAIDLYSTKC